MALYYSFPVKLKRYARCACCGPKHTSVSSKPLDFMKSLLTGRFESHVVATYPSSSSESYRANLSRKNMIPVPPLADIMLRKVSGHVMVWNRDIPLFSGVPSSR